jgi:chitinase
MAELDQYVIDHLAEAFLGHFPRTSVVMQGLCRSILKHFQHHLGQYHPISNARCTLLSLIFISWIFPSPVPTSDKQSYDLLIGPNPSSGSSQDPDADGFGWAIMSGPSSEISNFDKRDGSHWELYDCPTEKHEGRQTVKAVCTDTSPDSNCAEIYLGRGVAETIIELPEECGAGRYAMAVSLEPTANRSIPSDIHHRLMSRGIFSPKVYDFTFDFDFSPLQKRGDSKVQVRIDYSSVGGYWKKIVDADPHTTPHRKREIFNEVETVHGGSWKRYLTHQFKKERRETPEHELHILHKKWFSANLADWLTGQYDIDEEWELARLTYKDNFIYYLFNEQFKCTFQGLPVNAYFSAWAQLNIDVETSATLSLIVSRQ